MEKFIYFFVHLGIPLLVAVLFIRQKVTARASLLANGLLSVSMLLFLFLWGQWPLVGSFYFRYVLLGLLTFIVFYLIRKLTPGTPFLPAGWWKYTKLILVSVFALLFSYATITAVSGLRYNEQTIDLEFPLRGGGYYISSGGSRKIVNNHFRNYPNAQQFAIDINKLGPLGGASSNILSSENQLHHIFGEDLYSPCGGRIVEVVNDVDDNSGATMNVGPGDGQGNMVSIDCSGTIVSMMHLKKGSVRVESGQIVSAGERIGRVGNSGFSQEPHLHLQAARYNQDSVLVGVPMSFGNRSLVRNNVVRN